jgi:hypothetical protein
MIFFTPTLSLPHRRGRGFDGNFRYTLTGQDMSHSQTPFWSVPSLELLQQAAILSDGGEALNGP